ncbi:MAG: tetratricopeptide repeat protein, partial [Chloroflexota bacterium]|nr:tetratricopeptide repeat protein [Chloroflexota bacterium]
MPTRKPKKPTSRAPKAPGRRAAEPPVALPDRRLMERHLASMTRLLEEQEFETIEEANAYLENLLQQGGGKLPDVAPSTPLEEAQDLVYQALEKSGRKRLELARKALTISPDCADAYVILAEGTKDPHEARRLYEQGVAAGERALGPEFFAHEAGNFWGIFETRPYMRARLGLAKVLWHLGERRAAIEHLQEMLRLNPNDNQGVRQFLMHWLLAVGDLAALDRLLKQYPEEGFAAYEYTRALMLFRRYGAGKRSDKALVQAITANPFVPMYLLGLKPLPRRLPEYVGIGDENEAVAYLAEAAQNWLDTPGALEWLADVLVRHAPTPPD